MPKNVVLASFGFACTVVLAGERHCLGPGDLSADHIVDAQDHTLLIGCLAGPGSNPGLACPPEIALSADLDQDGDVDLLDVSKFAVSFGKSYFDYGPYREDKEAEHLAIKLTGQLRAPDYEYDRISRDLILMSTAYPDVEGITDSSTYGDNGLWVNLYSDDAHDEFDQLNSYYVAVGVSHPLPRIYFVTFCDVVNPLALDPLYSKSKEIEAAYPDIYGCLPGCCHGSINISTDSGIYRYQLVFYYSPGSGDRCGCWRFRILEVDEAGAVTQVSCEDGCLAGCP